MAAGSGAEALARRSRCRTVRGSRLRSDALPLSGEKSLRLPRSDDKVRPYQAIACISFLTEQTRVWYRMCSATGLPPLPTRSARERPRSADSGHSSDRVQRPEAEPLAAV